MARNGQTGIIPGSMGSNSYITSGKANKLSMSSSSHGAGRMISRTAFNIEMKHSQVQIEESLKDVVHSEFKKSTRGRDKGLIDYSETPQAYKDINSVMELQKDLVDILVTLKPMITLKG